MDYINRENALVLCRLSGFKLASNLTCSLHSSELVAQFRQQILRVNRLGEDFEFMPASASFFQ